MIGAILSLGATQRLNISITPLSTTPFNAQSQTMLCSANIGHYIRTEGVIASVANGAYFPPDIPYLLSLAAGETISVVTASGTGNFSATAVKTA